jgi:8-oxo-dGTP diphosphatase
MQFRNPTPAVDVIIETPGGIVLIERAHEPVGFALPGGFVDEGETVEQAAIREAMEETGLDIELDELLYVYSDPTRDPRRHTMSTVFIAHCDGVPKGGDDAASAFTASPGQLLDYRFVFDHRRIIEDYLHFKKTGQRPRPTVTKKGR